MISGVVGSAVNLRQLRIPSGCLPATCIPHCNGTLPMRDGQSVLIIPPPEVHFLKTFYSILLFLGSDLGVRFLCISCYVLACAVGPS